MTRKGERVTCRLLVDPPRISPNPPQLYGVASQWLPLAKNR